MAPPTLPGFYPHSEWAALGPVHVGVRSKAQAHHWVMDLGCWVLPSNRRSLKDPPLMRSHPNKAVDVAFHQTSEEQRCFERSTTDLRSLGIIQSAYGLIPKQPLL